VAKIDKIKEQIGWLKVIFGLLFATDVSLIAYLFNKIEVLSLVKIFLVFFVLILVTLGIIIINKKAIEKINELEDL